VLLLDSVAPFVKVRTKLGEGLNKGYVRSLCFLIKIREVSSNVE
jgi:hypothetical protein